MLMSGVEVGCGGMGVAGQARSGCGANTAKIVMCLFAYRIVFTIIDALVCIILFLCVYIIEAFVFIVWPFKATAI